MTAVRQPWMPADDYGRTLRPGLGVNLLVKNVQAAVRFAVQVLGATETYSDDNFAVLRFAGSEWMVHADHTFGANPLRGIIENIESRGAGVELMLYSCDPDQAEQAARDRGFILLARFIHQPH